MVTDDKLPLESEDPAKAFESRLLNYGSRLSLVQAYCALIKLAEFRGLDPQHAVRLRPALTMEMARSEIESIEREDREGSHSIYFINTNIFGLYGQRSPLPRSFTEDIAADMADDLPGMKIFLDLIHQRLHQLLIKSRIHKRPNFTAESMQAAQRSLFTMVGMRDVQSGRASRRFNQTVLNNLNIFRHQRGTTTGLRALFSSLFNSREIRLLEHEVRWVRLRDGERLSLGMSGHQIGFNSLVGSGLLDRHGLVTVSAGHISHKVYKTWLKNEEDWRDLKAITKKFLNQVMSVHLNYEVDQKSVFPQAEGSPQIVLGRNSWLLGSLENPPTLRASVRLV